MELGKRLKEYRTNAHMTQEELAEKIYVSRQSISSWENDKSYPDIHSLIMLSDLFHVSLDTLVKGDIEVMKEKIDAAAIRKFSRDSNIFSILLLITIISILPLYQSLKVIGMIIWIILAGSMLFFAFRVEKVKKENNIYSYKEIVAFMNGEKLDGIEKAREEGKRNYQRIILALLSGIIALSICILIAAIIEV